MVRHWQVTPRTSDSQGLAFWEEPAISPSQEHHLLYPACLCLWVPFCASTSWGPQQPNIRSVALPLLLMQLLSHSRFCRWNPAQLPSVCARSHKAEITANPLWVRVQLGHSAAVSQGTGSARAWLLDPASGSWMARSPPSEASEGGLAPGGHAECSCASCSCCPWEGGLTASAAPLPALGNTHPGSPGGTHSGWGLRPPPLWGEGA